MESPTAYKIYFDVDICAVIMEWEGYSTSRQFREGTEIMLNTLIKHQCSVVLADIKKMTLIGMEDQQWLQNDFLPRAIRFGFKAVAMVKPDAYFNKVAVKEVSERIDPAKLKISFFETRDDAAKWLSAQDQ